MSAVDPFYRTRQWRWLREETLRRSPICETAGCRRGATVADHVIPRSQGGADSLDNLKSRCAWCHNARRGTAEPRIKGCDARGTPDDPTHWWHAAPASRPSEDLPGLRAEDRPPGPNRVFPSPDDFWGF